MHVHGWLYTLQYVQIMISWGSDSPNVTAVETARRALDACDILAAGSSSAWRQTRTQALIWAWDCGKHMQGAPQRSISDLTAARKRRVQSSLYKDSRSPCGACVEKLCRLRARDEGTRHRPNRALGRSLRREAGSWKLRGLKRAKDKSPGREIIQKVLLTFRRTARASKQHRSGVTTVFHSH